MASELKESRHLRLIRRIYHDDRPMEKIREHYELEKKLASRLLNSCKEERGDVYTEVYDELMQNVADHFYTRLAIDTTYQRKQRESSMSMLRRHLDTDTVYVEIGPGDCNVAFEVAKHVKKVYAIDVSHEITRKEAYPENFELIISDGSSVPLDKGSVDIVYSNQLMEHIHPEDALEQLRNIYDVIKPGGHYLCRTPNGLSGPHDISVFFDDEPTGFHLKEYTYCELDELFQQVGFSKRQAIIGARGLYIPFLVPIWPLKILEKVLFAMPRGLRKSLCHTLPFCFIFSMQVLATK